MLYIMLYIYIYKIVYVYIYIERERCIYIYMYIYLLGVLAACTAAHTRLHRTPARKPAPKGLRLIFVVLIVCSLLVYCCLKICA